ncbi:MAG: beta-propeller domain-containing protein, partial [Acidimicrobiia bacterium]
MRKSALIIALALVAAACTTGGTTTTLSGGTTPTTRGSIPHIERPSFAALAALSTVDSCEELLDHFKAEALLRVGPWGLDGYGGYYPFPVLRDGVFSQEDFAAATTVGPATEGPQAGGEFRASSQVEGIDYSGTNVQERGVDEPDIVKTDGERIFAIVNNEEIFYEQGYYDGYGSGAVLIAIDITE